MLKYILSFMFLLIGFIPNAFAYTDHFDGYTIGLIDGQNSWHGSAYVTGLEYVSQYHSMAFASGQSTWKNIATSTPSFTYSESFKIDGNGVDGTIAELKGNGSVICFLHKSINVNTLTLNDTGANIIGTIAPNIWHTVSLEYDGTNCRSVYDGTTSAWYSAGAGSEIDKIAYTVNIGNVYIDDVSFNSTTTRTTSMQIKRNPMPRTDTIKVTWNTINSDTNLYIATYYGTSTIDDTYQMLVGSVAVTGSSDLIFPFTDHTGTTTIASWQEDTNGTYATTTYDVFINNALPYIAENRADLTYTNYITNLFMDRFPFSYIKDLWIMLDELQAGQNDEYSVSLPVVTGISNGTVATSSLAILDTTSLKENSIIKMIRPIISTVFWFIFAFAFSRSIFGIFNRK